MTTPLVDALCRFNKCGPLNLAKALARRREENLNFINDKTLMTTHLMIPVIVKPSTFSRNACSKTYAFGGFLGITVPQYLYIRHSIRLEHAELPCICVFGGKRRDGRPHVTFYPLELLEIFV